MRVVIQDRTIAGAITREMAMDFLTESMTLRELIRERVYQEVKDHNARAGSACGAGATSALAETGSGSHMRQRGSKRNGTADFQEEFDRAIQAFERSRYFVLVGDHQPMDLDEHITLRPDMQVSFVQLVHLTGG